jgi:hypothetical protein
MGVEELSNQGSLFDSGVYLENLLKHSKDAEKFLFFREHIWPQLVRMEPSLKRMYCLDNGRPAVNPVRLLGVTLLQYMEKLPDRQAVGAMVFDLRWKCALEMEVDEGGFDPTALVRFRERVRAHNLEGIGLEAVLEAMRKAGYLKKKTAYRVDSAQVFGLVAQMSRLECVRETMRLALLALGKRERLARPEEWPLWWERYVETKPDYREKEDGLRLKMIQAGEDIGRALLWIKGLGEDAPQCAEVELLGRVFAENFERSKEGQIAKRRAQPPGAVINPHDPEAQWSAKDTARQTEWVGYKAQVAETVEEQPRKKGEPTKAVITAIATQEAISSDKAALPVVERTLEALGESTPKVTYADAGYTSGGELARAQRDGRELRGPMAPPPKRGKRYDSEQFDVSIEKRSALCPAGEGSTNCSRLENGETGAALYRFEWNRNLCKRCGHRKQCLGKDQNHRTLVVGEHHDLIQARRREQQTEEFQKDMRHRNAIEGTISELCRKFGMRRCRYRGIRKTMLQNFMTAAACDIARWWRRETWELRGAMKAILAETLAAAPTCNSA